MRLPIVEQLPETPDAAHFDIVERARENLGKLVEGNGLQPEQLRITQDEVIVHTLPGLLIAKIKAEIAHETLQGRHTVGEGAASMQDAHGKAQSMAAKALGDENIAKMLDDILAKDAGGGWGMDDQKFPLQNALHKDYSFAENCNQCAGAGQVSCTQCNATGQMPCPRCEGHGRISCRHCMETGRIPQPDGSSLPCSYCQTSGFEPCLHCQNRKTVPCDLCDGAMRIRCKPCEGSGAQTQVFRATFVLETHFDIDRKTIDPRALDAALKIGVRKLATDGHCEIFRTPPFPLEGSLQLPFFAFFGLCDAAFSIAGKPCPAWIAGLKGTVLQVEPFLDAHIKPGIAALSKLARGPFAKDALIANACKYRVLRTTLQTLMQAPKKKAYQDIIKTYPGVISDKYAKASIKYASAALSALAQGPRQKGLVVGSVLALVLYAAYFFAQARAMLAPALGKHIAGADILCALGGAALAYYAVRMMAAKSLKTLLPQSAGAKKHGLPPAGNEGLIALALCLVAFVALAALAPQTPAWLAIIMKK